MISVTALKFAAMLTPLIFLIWIPFIAENAAITEKTPIFDDSQTGRGDERFDCAGTSLESFLYDQSRILERYPDLSAECHEEECVRPEGFVDEQERISALHAEIVARLGSSFDSEEFYRLMMLGDNPADCSDNYGEFEMFVSCVTEEYLYRKGHMKTLPLSTRG